MSRLPLVACLSVLAASSSGMAADNWADHAGNSVNHVSGKACDVMTSALTKWFVKDEGYTTKGFPAASKLYAVMSANRIEQVVKGKKTGILVIEQHQLSNKDGVTLAKSYSEVASASVPYFLQFGAIPFPEFVGGAITLLDWALHLNSVQRTTAADLVTLMPSGGTLSKSLAIAADQPPHRWLLQQIAFETTVNNQKRSYVVCSWAFPLKE